MKSTLIKSGRRIADKLQVDNQPSYLKANIAFDHKSGTYKITLEVTTKQVASDPSEREEMYSTAEKVLRAAVDECVEMRQAHIVAKGEQGELDLEEGDDGGTDDEHEPQAQPTQDKQLRMGRRSNAMQTEI